MKKSKLSPKDFLLLGVLILVLLGAGYYLLFYSPLQEEILSTNMQNSDTQSEILVAQSELASLKKMQEELDALFASGAKVSEIAPYDNAKVIMSELNGILGQTLNYKLSFVDPVVAEDGMVRRTVNMNFTCGSYASAKQVINKLCSSQWRCLMRDVTMEGAENLEESEVSCSASLVFYESTKLQ